VSLPQYTAVDANRLSATAEALLRLDPALSPVAQLFSRAAAAIGRAKTPAEIGVLVDQAAVGLSTAARKAAPSSPPIIDPSTARLRGALADYLRRAGGRR
jgi:hypothetical protein